MTLQTNFYFLSPVEVARVTPKNIEEVAEWCGGKVAETESRRQEGRMDKYVWVPTPKGSAISWAFPGMFITKRLVITENNEMKVTYSVFRKGYFKANYFQSPNEAVEATWDRQSSEAGKKVHAKPELVQGTLKPELTDLKATPDMVDATDIKEIVAPAGSNMVAQRQLLREAEIENTPLVIGDALSPFVAGSPDRA